MKDILLLTSPPPPLVVAAILVYKTPPSGEAIGGDGINYLLLDFLSFETLPTPRQYSEGTSESLIYVTRSLITVDGRQGYQLCDSHINGALSVTGENGVIQYPYRENK